MSESQRRDVRVAAIGVLVMAALSGGSALLGLVAGLVSPAARVGGLVGGVIGAALACGLGLAGTRLLRFEVRGAHLATRILGVLAVLGGFALFRNIRSGMFIERWPGLLGVLAGLAITIGLIYLQHRAVQSLTPAAAVPTPAVPTPAAPPVAEPSAMAAGAPPAAAPPAAAGAGPVTATSPAPPPQQPTAPQPSDQQRTVRLLLIGGGVGSGLIVFAVLLVGALIWPGWLVSAPVPPEDEAMSTMTVLAEGIESRNAVTMQSVICGDADPYVTAFTQRALKEINLANVEGRPTVDGATAEAKLRVDNDGVTTVWDVELAPRNARAWCVTGIHL